jgi:hypothetical protein
MLLGALTARRKLVAFELLWMMWRDQRLMSRHPLKARAAQRAAARHPKRLQRIVERHGWPGVQHVGIFGAQAAWLIAQHADLEPDFQSRCLELLRQAVATGDAQPQHLAYLEDRVRVNRDRPQLYGTQCRLVDGALQPAPIEDESNVDARRAALGLGPLADYLREMRSVQPPDGA